MLAWHSPHWSSLLTSHHTASGSQPQIMLPYCYQPNTIHFWRRCCQMPQMERTMTVMTEWILPSRGAAGWKNRACSSFCWGADWVIIWSAHPSPTMHPHLCPRVSACRLFSPFATQLWCLVVTMWWSVGWWRGGCGVIVVVVVMVVWGQCRLAKTVMCQGMKKGSAFTSGGRTAAMMAVVVPMMTIILSDQVIISK